VEFLAIAHLVPAGMSVTASDLVTVSISPVAGLDAIPLRDVGQVLGRRVTEDLEPGSLVVPGDLTSKHGLPAGVALGTSLAVDEMPTGLAAGQRVLVVLSGTSGATDTSPANFSSSAVTPSAANGSAIAGSVPSPTGPPGSILTKATVISTSAPGGSSDLTGSQSTSLLATLEVPQAAAAAVTAASAVGNVSLAVIGGFDSTGASK
jgi:hypothetical protein